MAHEHILVLEDHAEQREQMREILVEAGYAVEVAGTAAEAVASARRIEVDLVVADIFLPDVSGIDAFREIRQIRPDAAGIVVTGFSSWEMAMEALQVGFVGFIVKPFLPEQLVTSIVNALEQEKLRRENARLRALVPLYELSRAFMGTLELHELLDQIIATARQETKAEVVSLMLFDEDRRELRIAAASGLSNEVIETQKRALGNGVAGRVAETGEPIMINQGTQLVPGIRGIIGRPEIYSALSLPLRSRGEVIGVLNLSRTHAGEPFGPGDLELATVLASQAAASIDKARLFSRLEQFAEISQQLATASDLEEAISIIVNAPLRLVHARGAALWLIEAGVQPTLVHAQGSEDLLPPTPGDEIVEAFIPEGDHGWVMLPLRHGDKSLGALTVCLRTPSPPNEDRLGVLRTLTHTASAVIESHRLRAREVLAFREVDRTVRADLNTRQMLERLLDQMLSVCQAESGGVFLWDSEHDRIEPWVACGTVPSEDLARKAVRLTRVGVLSQSPEDSGMAIGAPMRVGGRIEGAVVLTRSTRAGGFAARQTDLLSTLTSSAALIIRNTQLYARSEEAAIAEERTRIAREIHDGLAQDLAFLVLKTSAAQKLLSRADEKGLQKELREISEQLRQDAREVRRVIFALRPLNIEALGFLPALDKFVKEFAQANDIELQYEIHGDGSHLPAKLETALFRLTQEALNNVRRHAHAKHTWVELEFIDGVKARLCIRDDGRGFDVEKVLAAARERGSVGLVQMRERAERAGGTFRIESTPSAGTCVQVELPIREL
jgi:signal transduction histidine kinase/DNA-binding response OmpR family regulator